MDVIYPTEREDINRREEAIKAVVEALEEYMAWGVLPPQYPCFEWEEDYRRAEQALQRYREETK